MTFSNLVFEIDTVVLDLRLELEEMKVQGIDVPKAHCRLKITYSINSDTNSFNLTMLPLPDIQTIMENTVNSYRLFSSDLAALKFGYTKNKEIVLFEITCREDNYYPYMYISVENVNYQDKTLYLTVRNTDVLSADYILECGKGKIEKVEIDN